MKGTLIEQAAQRLEELRRSGVESPQDAGSASATPSSPMPSQQAADAMVLALEARSAHGGAIRPRADLKGFAKDAAPKPDADARHIEINFPRLKARGFVTPDAGSSQIAEEFRVIKRPIIRNAVGRGAVKHGNLVMVTSALPSEGKTFTS